MMTHCRKVFHCTIQKTHLVIISVMYVFNPLHSTAYLYFPSMSFVLCHHCKDNNIFIVIILCYVCVWVGGNTVLASENCQFDRLNDVMNGWLRDINVSFPIEYLVFCFIHHFNLLSRLDSNLFWKKIIIPIWNLRQESLINIFV